MQEFRKLILKDQLTILKLRPMFQSPEWLLARAGSGLEELKEFLIKPCTKKKTKTSQN